MYQQRASETIFFLPWEAKFQNLMPALHEPIIASISGMTFWDVSSEICPDFSLDPPESLTVACTFLTKMMRKFRRLLELLQS